MELNRKGLRTALRGTAYSRTAVCPPRRWHAADAGSQQNLAMLAGAGVAPVLAGTAFQRTSFPAAKWLSIHAAVGVCRAFLRWPAAAWRDAR